MIYFLVRGFGLAILWAIGLLVLFAIDPAMFPVLQ